MFIALQTVFTKQRLLQGKLHPQHQHLLPHQQRLPQHLQKQDMPLQLQQQMRPPPMQQTQQGMPGMMHPHGRQTAPMPMRMTRGRQGMGGIPGQMRTGGGFFTQTQNLGGYPPQQQPFMLGQNISQQGQARGTSMRGGVGGMGLAHGSGMHTSQPRVMNQLRNISQQVFIEFVFVCCYVRCIVF